MRIQRVHAFLFLVAFALAATAAAQTRISGIQQCKSEPPAPVTIPDRPNHAYAIVKAQCTWTKPMEMAGTQTRDGLDTIQTEMSGDDSTDHGYYTGNMANGDTIAVRFQGTGKAKAGKPVSGQGTWSFTGGSGKLKGIKGKGTYKGTANPDGSMTYTIDGEYALP